MGEVYKNTSLTKHPAMSTIANEFGFEIRAHQATPKEFLDLIVKSENLKAWVEYNDSARHLLPKGGGRPRGALPLEELCTKAMEAFRGGQASEDEKNDWNIADHILRFMARYMKSLTQPGEIWAEEDITPDHFGKVRTLLRYIDIEMMNAPLRGYSVTTLAMVKAMEEQGLALRVPLPVRSDPTVLRQRSSRSRRGGDQSLEKGQGSDFDKQKAPFLTKEMEVKFQAASLSSGTARSPGASMDSATKSRFPGAQANSVERPANNEGGAAMERDTLIEQGQPSKIPAATRSQAAPQASVLRPMKRERSPPVIDLTGDDDDNNKRMKVELEEFTSTGTAGPGGTGGTHIGQDVSRSLEVAQKMTLETEVWWPGKMSFSKNSPPPEDDGVWWPGKLAELFQSNG